MCQKCGINLWDGFERSIDILNLWRTWDIDFTESVWWKRFVRTMCEFVKWGRCDMRMCGECVKTCVMNFDLRDEDLCIDNVRWFYMILNLRWICRMKIWDIQLTKFVMDWWECVCMMILWCICYKNLCDVLMWDEFERICVMRVCDGSLCNEFDTMCDEFVWPWICDFEFVLWIGNEIVMNLSDTNLSDEFVWFRISAMKVWRIVWMIW